MKNKPILPVFLFLISLVFSKPETVSFNVFQQADMTEFAGGDTRAQLTHVSINSIKGFCASVDGLFGSGSCDGDGLSRIFRSPNGIILAPSENDNTKDFRLLVTVDAAGFLVFMDAEPTHMETKRGFTYAKIGLFNLGLGAGSALRNIVSDFKGNFWIVDLGQNKVIRLSHSWSGSHVFSVVGEIQFDNSQLVDVYFSDMKTSALGDDRLYIATRRESKILVVDPYFSSKNVEPEMHGARNLNVSLGGSILDPQSIFGAYNGELESVADPRDIYVVHNGFTLTLIRDYGLESNVVRETLLPANFKSDFSSIRTNLYGEIYAVDAGNSTIHKFGSDFGYLFSTGKPEGGSSATGLEFANLKGMAIRGKEIFTTESYSPTTGIRRFANAAIILKNEFSGLSDLGYNPANAGSNVTPYPKARFKISEYSDVKLSIYQLDGANKKVEIWSKAMGELPSGWSEGVFDWDGTKDGKQVDKNVFFAVETKKFFEDGDHSVVKEVIIDTKKPDIEDPGKIEFTSYPSTSRPFWISVPYSEKVAGSIRILNSAGALIDVIEIPGDKPEDFKPTLSALWPVKNLGDCEAFSVEVQARDYAGNITAITRINGPGGQLPNVAFSNSSGGFTNLDFSLSPRTISSVSTIPANRFASIHADVTNVCTAVPFYYNIKVFNTPSMTGNPVFALGPDAGNDRLVETGAFTKDWHGTDNTGKVVPDGTYYTLVTLESLAGFSASSKSVTSFDNTVRVKTSVPQITLTGNGSNKTVQIDGDTFLFVSGDDKVGATVSYNPPTVPTEGKVVIEYTLFTTGGTVTTFKDEYEMSEIIGGKILIPEGDSRSRLGGKYLFSAYFVDEAGNSGRVANSTNTIKQGAASIGAFVIDNTRPSLLVDVDQSILSKPQDVKVTLFNNTSGFSDGRVFSYTYDMAIKSPSGQVTTVKSNIALPQSVLKVGDMIPKSFLSANGTYQIVATLKDNVGRQSDKASAFVYLNDRPNAVGVNLAVGPVSGKTYITGALGDPYITTGGVDKAFDNYLLLYKAGANQVPVDLDPVSLAADGWKSSTGPSPAQKLFAPFYRQDALSQFFPYSNSSIVPTNLQGVATVGFMDAGGLANGGYTLLALSFEKDNPVPRLARTNFSVDNATEPDAFQFGKFDIQGDANGTSVSYLLSKSANLHFVVAKYDEVAKRYTKKVNEFHFANVPGETVQEFSWNFDDAFGNKVDDGNYRILALAEDLGSTAADWRESGSISANTSIQVTHVSVAPALIVVPPRIGATIPNENEANVSFISNKYCSAKLVVYFAGAIVAETAPKTFDASGVSTPKVVTWDGSGNGVLPYDAARPFELKLVVSSLDDPGDRIEIGGIQVKRVSPAAADSKPGIPTARISMDNPDLFYDAVPDQTTAGTDEVYWQTRLKGKTLSGGAAIATGQIGISGRQNVSIWKSNPTDNAVHIKVKKQLEALKNVTISYSWEVFDQSGGLIRKVTTTRTNEVGTHNSGWFGNSATVRPRPGFVKFTLLGISSGNLPNDLLPFVKVDFSYEVEDVGDGIFELAIIVRAHMDLLKFSEVVTKDIQSTGASWPDHYSPLDLTESAANDFPDVFYNAGIYADYSYEIVKLPENGSLEFPDFTFSPTNAPPYMTNGLIINTAAVVGTYTTYCDCTPSYTPSDVILHTGSSLDKTTPILSKSTPPLQMANNQKYLAHIRVRSESEETVNMFWPFPATGVPATTIDGKNYATLAYKTSTNSDPRKDGTNFVNIVGPYRVNASSAIGTNGQVIQPYSVSLHPDVSYPFNIAILPNLYPVPLSSLVPGSVSATLLATGRNWPVGAALTVNGNNLTVNSTLDPMPRIDWSSADDPLVSAHSPLGTLGYRETFSKNGLVLKSPPIDIPFRYQQMTGMPSGTGALTDINSYRFSFWRNASGNMIDNAVQQPSAKTYAGLFGGPATLTYADGSLNDALQLDDFSTLSNSFTLKHAPNSTPKRFVEIRGAISNSDATAFDKVSLDYYGVESKKWNEFGSIATAPVNGLPDLTLGVGPKVLGYWDVTHCNGAYILRLSVEKDGGMEEAFQSINIGTPVDAPANGVQYVYSPYSKAQLTFPAGSQYKGDVSIVPIKPSDIRGVNLDKARIIPKGPLLEISPSGLVFDKTALPNVTFTMTADDVEDMGVSADHLGEINIYYVDEKRGELVPLETGISRFIMRDGSTTPEPVAKGGGNADLVGKDLFNIVAPIEHTSIYGSFSDALEALKIQPPPTLVSATPLPSLSGTITGLAVVNVYVSKDGVLDKTEPSYEAMVSGGIWSVTDLPLNEGRNFLFAVATINGKETVVQTEVTLDQTPPVLTGNFQSQYVSYNAEVPYSFEVSSSEGGTILVKEVGNPNALTSEYALSPSESGGYKATVQILPSAFKDSRTIVELHAVDEVGNSSSRQYIEVLVDNEPPTLLLSNTDIHAPITGSLKDFHAVDRVELTVSLPGVEVKRVAPFASGVSGNFSFTLDFGSLPEGDGMLSLVGFDRAQNSVTYGPLPIHNKKGVLSKSDALVEYIFKENAGTHVQDVSGRGIPQDLELSGSGVIRLANGGISFPVDNHGSKAKSGIVNPKLFDNLTQSNEIAVEFWFKSDTTSQANIRRIVEMGSEVGTNNWNFAAGQVGKNLYFKLRTQSAQSVDLQTSNNPLAQPGTLHHVMMIYAPYNPASGAGGMRIYLDKVQQALNQEYGLLSGTGAFPWGRNYGLYLGNRPGATVGGWKGDLLMTAIYDRYFDSDQVRERFEAGIPDHSDFDRVLLGLSSADRVNPAKVAQGIQKWKEDSKESGGGLAMAGVPYPAGLSGSPAAGGAPSLMIYDLNGELSRLGLARPVRHVSGFMGRQDNAGSVNVQVKTSSSLANPTEEDWKNNTGSVLVRAKAQNLQNTPIDFDLEGAKWLMLGMDSESPDNSDIGVLGQAEIILGDRTIPSRNGIRYRYFEGTWSSLPDFANLAPVKTGTVEGFDLSPRLRSDNFGFRYEGYIEITTQGLYTFYSNSDDGSRIYIDQRIVVDNDGIHPLQEVSGAVFLSPGYHRITVDYFDKDGSEGLAIGYSGPGVSKQPIPDGVLFKEKPETPALEGGISYRYFEGNWSLVPDFGKLVPVKVGIAANFDLGKRNKDDYFGFQFEGFISLLNAGNYAFHLNSDDGAKLFIDDLLVVSNDGIHPATERDGSIDLSEGVHKIRVDYFETQGGQVLDVAYEGPGVSKRSIPSGVLSHSVERPKFELPISINTTASGANVANSVSAFPILVKLDSSNFDFSSSQPDGSDIRFRAVDGSSLPFEIELWNSGYRQAAIWVKMDVPGNSVSTIFMQWGNPLAAGGSSPHDVFAGSNGFAGVWHLGEPGNSTVGGYLDATGNPNQGTGINMGNGSSVLGISGLAQTFNGQNQFSAGCG
jgi:hypothetical protein